MKNASTIAIHAGEADPRIEGAICLPVFQSANYEFIDTNEYEKIRYARLNNSPNHEALHKKLAALEGAEDALVLGSGMAAISTTLLALLSHGDHVIAQKTLYGATFSLLTKELPRFGIECNLAEGDNGWKKLLKQNTKMIYVEAMSNPLLEVPEFDELIAFAKEHGLLAVIDNTFATPINFKPVPRGFDISLHSATKYLNGHSDVIAGAVIGSKALIKKINAMAMHLGGTLDPHACSLLHRGIKTLPMRVAEQQKTAMKIARHLSQHNRIAQVNFPGLETSPSFARAKKYFTGFGTMISFELKNESAVDAFLTALKIPVLAASLGGVESLVIKPARSSHLSLNAEDRKKAGISDGLIRLSVGLEGEDDLIADLNQALLAIE